MVSVSSIVDSVQTTNQFNPVNSLTTIIYHYAVIKSFLFLLNVELLVQFWLAYLQTELSDVE